MAKLTAFDENKLTQIADSLARSAAELVEAINLMHDNRIKEIYIPWNKPHSEGLAKASSLGTEVIHAINKHLSDLRFHGESMARKRVEETEKAYMRRKKREEKESKS